MGSALLVMQNNIAGDCFLQAGQEKTFPHGPQSIAQWIKQGNASWSSELPSSELDLAELPWPGAELFSGRLYIEQLCLQTVVATARSFHWSSLLFTRGVVVPPSLGEQQLEGQDMLSSSEMGLAAPSFCCTVRFPSHTCMWGALKQLPPVLTPFSSAF